MMLSVEQLTVSLRTAHGRVEAVRGVSFEIAAGDTLGLIGESGSGKSLTALALMGLLPEGAEARGQVRLGGQDLLALDEAGWCAVRGRRIAMIFQEPMTALNPLHRVSRQVAEPLRLHQRLPAAAAQAEALRLLDRVGLGAERAGAYPHQLSGGQRQRVTIAMALAAGPELLIADEPTTALDASLQGQILALLAELVAERGMGLLLISHDLALMARHARRLKVMYAGRIVESGPTAAVFAQRGHLYTQGLFAARPQLGARVPRLAAMPGTVPDLHALPPGCAFHPRCPLAEDACRQYLTPQPIAPDHWALCRRLDQALQRHG